MGGRVCTHMPLLFRTHVVHARGAGAALLWGPGSRAGTALDDDPRSSFLLKPLAGSLPAPGIPPNSQPVDLPLAASQVGTSLLFLACIGIIIPTMARQVYGSSIVTANTVLSLSHAIAILLIFV